MTNWKIPSEYRDINFPDYSEGWHHWPCSFCTNVLLLKQLNTKNADAERGCPDSVHCIQFEFNSSFHVNSLWKGCKSEHKAYMPVYDSYRYIQRVHFNFQNTWGNLTFGIKLTKIYWTSLRCVQKQAHSLPTLLASADILFCLDCCQANIRMLM